MTHRQYSRRSKIGVVVAATMTSLADASAATGIPSSTIRYWLDSPEFADIRTKTREDMATEARVLAHRTLDAIRQRMAEFEPRDLTILFGVLVDKSQLLAGEATSRNEHRDITDDLDDHERDALRAVLDDVLAEVTEPSG